MADFLFGYGIPLWEALLILLGIGIIVVFGYRRLRQRQARLERELVELRARDEPESVRALHDHLQSAIAHEFVKGLDYIRDKSEQTLRELADDQLNLRDKQNLIVAKSYELIQHAHNIVGLFSANQEEPQRQIVNLKGVAEEVLSELYSYALVSGVTLQPRLANVEPIMVNRHFAVQILRNVIHNAIKYSPRGSLVDVRLDLRVDGTSQEKQISVEVQDRGKGISEKDQARLFELLKRGDGLVEPGTGLGLHYARMLARLHGGDVTLVESAPQQGSTFRIVFPYK